jgi:hypothetical protein
MFVIGVEKKGIVIKSVINVISIIVLNVKLLWFYIVCNVSLDINFYYLSFRLKLNLSSL